MEVERHQFTWICRERERERETHTLRTDCNQLGSILGDSGVFCRCQKGEKTPRSVNSSLGAPLGSLSTNAATLAPLPPQVRHKRQQASLFGCHNFRPESDRESMFGRVAATLPPHKEGQSRAAGCQVPQSRLVVAFCGPNWRRQMERMLTQCHAEDVPATNHNCRPAGPS